MKPVENWVRTLGVAALILIGVAGLAALIWTAWLFHDLPDAGELADYRAPTSTRVYAWDGTLIGEFSTERRIFVPYEQMPPHLVRAFLAAEDQNFYNHAGVDPQGLSRAMARVRPMPSTPPCLKKFRSSAARKACTSCGGIWS